jgi:hypothetical protein
LFHGYTFSLRPVVVTVNNGLSHDPDMMRSIVPARYSNAIASVQYFVCLNRERKRGVFWVALGSGALLHAVLNTTGSSNCEFAGTYTMIPVQRQYSRRFFAVGKTTVYRLTAGTNTSGDAVRMIEPYPPEKTRQAVSKTPYGKKMTAYCSSKTN